MGAARAEPKVKNKWLDVTFPYPSFTSLEAQLVTCVLGGGCNNLAFFKSDCLNINGFNNDFEGWGREDSEFALRLINSGINRKSVRFNMIQFHLWHQISSREVLKKNDLILTDAIINKIDIGIHIADVSHFLKKDSILDKEAYKRGTSVYLVDRVVPMLPESLSNNLCSLRPKEDKYTFSALFTFNKKLQIEDFMFHQQARTYFLTKPLFNIKRC